METSHLVAFVLGAIFGGPYIGWKIAKWHTKMRMIDIAVKKARRESV